MPSPLRNVDALGGGFFGARIAVALSRRVPAVAVFEREPQLLTRAPCNNQARVHGGYHHPRGILTSLRSRANDPRLIQDYPDAVDRAFTKRYAIATHNSKVSARQFSEFCRRIGAPALVALDVTVRAVEPGGARHLQPDVNPWTR